VALEDARPLPQRGGGQARRSGHALGARPRRAYRSKEFKAVVDSRFAGYAKPAFLQ
jgi:hypothetical protein